MTLISNLDFDALNYQCALATVGLFLLIYLPITIAQSRQFSQMMISNHVIFRKRFPEITLIQGFLLVIKLLIVSIVYLSIIVDNTLLVSVVTILNHGITLISYYLWILRFWMSHFQLQFIRQHFASIANDALTLANTATNANSNWQTLINSAYVTQLGLGHGHRSADAHHNGNGNGNNDHQNRSEAERKHAWYVSKQSTFGNMRWFKNHFILPGIGVSLFFVCVPRLVMYFVFDDQKITNTVNMYVSLFETVVMLIPSLFLFVIYWWKTPVFNDTFFVVLEMKYIFTSLFVYNLIWVVFDAYMIVFKPELKSPSFAIVSVVVFNIVVGCQWIGFMISTFWVMRKVLPIILKQQHKSNKIRTDSIAVVNQDFDDSAMANASMPLVQIRAGFITENDGVLGKDNKNKLHLNRCFSHEQACQLFMSHLTTEFSMENLLAFIEFLQYQRYVYAYLNQGQEAVNSINDDGNSAGNSISDGHGHEQNETDNNTDAKNTNMNDSLLNESLLYDDDDENEERESGILWINKIRFFDGMPQSEIVFENQNRRQTHLNRDYLTLTEKELKFQVQFIARDLYLKYIAQEAEFQIYLDPEIQQRYERLIENTDTQFLFNDGTQLKDLMFLFNVCCQEIYTSLLSSFDRFKCTRAFSRLNNLVFL